jgi:hypothetical protein
MMNQTIVRVEKRDLCTSKREGNMTRVEILAELQRLPLTERLAIIDALLHQVQEDIEQIEQPSETITQAQLAAAVELMRKE